VAIPGPASLCQRWLEVGAPGLADCPQAQKRILSVDGPELWEFACEDFVVNLQDCVSVIAVLLQV